LLNQFGLAEGSAAKKLSAGLAGHRVCRKIQDAVTAAKTALRNFSMPFKKIMVAVVGGTILVTGFALLVLPGPAFVVIPVGLAVLATEFVWARRWLKRARGMVNKRKARRTTRALAVTCRRRWERWRQWFARWRRTPAPRAESKEINGPNGAGRKTDTSSDSDLGQEGPASSGGSPAPEPPGCPAGPRTR